MKKLSVVAPVFNEEELVEELVSRISKTLKTLKEWEGNIVIVDDGSNDDTFLKLTTLSKQAPNLSVVSLSRNFGHQAAVTAGIDHAKGDAIVVMDGDLQDPPELIPNLLEKHEEGFDVVYAIRAKRKEGFLKRGAYSLFYRILRLFSNHVPMPKDAGDFSLISVRVADVIRRMPERNRFVRGLRAWAGFSQVGIPYQRERRYAGKPKYSFLKLMRLAYDGIFSFSYVPITIVTIIGFVSSLAAFVGIATVLYFRITQGREIPGFASLAIFILFFGGVQLVGLGVLGEYIRRMYDEVKQRPHYVVKSVIQSRH